MKIHRMCFVITGMFLLLIAAVANVVVGEEPVTAKTESLDALVAACQEAKSNFRALTDVDLKSIKAELVEAAARLDARLKLDGANGEDWRKYLLFETLQKELQQEGAANRESLNQVYQRFASGNEGLGLVWFVDVQSALRRFLMVGGAIDNEQTKTLYEQTLEKLANSIQSFAANPNTEDALGISESVRWLKNARQAPELVAAVEQRFNNPNLYIEVSADLVSAGIGEPVDDTSPVRDCIMGTDIYGTGHTIGQTSAELFPNEDHAVVDTLLFATTHSKTVGYHGPVCIYTDGTTCIGARKRLWINENGIFSYPGVSNAVTHTCITDIQARRRLIEKMAWKRAGKQMATAEYIAARHAEQRVNHRIDAKAADTLDKADHDFKEKFRRPLVEHKLFPELLRFNTDREALHVTSLEIGNSRLAAPVQPPHVTEADMTLRLHESMINNFTLDALGGMTVHEEKFQQAVIDMIGRLPEKMKGDEDQEPWAITFARRQPVSVTFADDGFKITIRGSEYYKGDTQHPAMDVSVTYKIEKTEKGFKAVRQGEIQVFPPGRQQVGGKEQIIRTLLTKRFGKVFEPELLGEGFTFEGKWEKVGKMQPIELSCRDGWLTIAWRRVPTEQKVQ
ncbi:MAG TPA: hypothetical protein VIH42_11175 [Thermoguttaceae bacterium]